MIKLVELLPPLPGLSRVSLVGSRTKIPSMTDGPRNYSAGTKAALFALGKGTCYFPSCDKPVLEKVGEAFVIAMQIAHIKGANEGSARYDPEMTDEERAAFSNLLLLCTTHHKVIDGPRSAEYPAELLREWKATHEQKIEGLPASGITADNLEQLLEAAFSKLAPSREVQVELEAGVMIPGQPIRASFGAMTTLLELNEHLRGHPRSIAATVRNKGFTDVTVSEIALIYGSKAGPAMLKGRNDYPYTQSLPHRLLGGESVDWLTSVSTVQAMMGALRGNELLRIHAEVLLASGEVIEAAPVPWSELEGFLKL